MLIKIISDLRFFAVWQWHAAHSSAEPTELCSKMWQCVFFRVLPSPWAQLPRKKLAFGWCRKRELPGFSLNAPIPAQSSWKVPTEAQADKRNVVWLQLLALYSHVTDYSGPVSSLTGSFQKTSSPHASSVLMLQATNAIILFLILDACLDLGTVFLLEEERYALCLEKLPSCL